VHGINRSLVAAEKKTFFYLIVGDDYIMKALCKRAVVIVIVMHWRKLIAAIETQLVFCDNSVM